MNLATMSDEQLEGTIKTLSEELSRRRWAEAREGGITISSDPRNFQPDRVLFHTPLGEMLVQNVNGGLGSDIRFANEDVSNTVYEPWIDDKWTAMYEDGILDSDTAAILQTRDRGFCAYEGLRVFKKWEELLRLIGVHGVQGS